MPPQQRRVMDCCPQDFNKCAECIRAFEYGHDTCPICTTPYSEIPSHSPAHTDFEGDCDHWMCVDCWRQRRWTRNFSCPCCGIDLEEWLLEESLYETEDDSDEEYDSDEYNSDRENSQRNE